jgi:hypothetical protein
MLHVTTALHPVVPQIPVVVDEAFVRDHPEAVLADVRWYLDGRDGRAAFEPATSRARAGSTSMRTSPRATDPPPRAATPSRRLTTSPPR